MGLLSFIKGLLSDVEPIGEQDLYKLINLDTKEVILENKSYSFCMQRASVLHRHGTRTEVRPMSYKGR
jgi:hypothetical protein